MEQPPKPPFKSSLINVARQFAARARFAWVLRSIRALPRTRLRARLIALFDPNEIRKAVRWVPRPRLLEAESLGSSLVVDGNDHIGYRVLMEGAFDKGFHALAMRLTLGPDDILLDIGANIGTESIPVAARTGCTVISIEASKRNAAMLFENATRNGVRLRAHTVAVTSEAMARDQPWLDFQINAGNTGSNSIFSGWNPSMTDTPTEPVPTATLDSLLSDEDLAHIALAKIDVEGAESLALSGAPRLRAAGIPIVFEYRPDATSKSASGESEALLALLGPDFSLFALDGDGGTTAFDPARSYENVLALPKTRTEDYRHLIDPAASQ